ITPPAAPETYSLPLHDALPISARRKMPATRAVGSRFAVGLRFGRAYELDACETPLADLEKMRLARAHGRRAIADPLAVEPDCALIDEPHRLRRAGRETCALQDVCDSELFTFYYELLEHEIVRSSALSMHLVEAALRALGAVRIVESLDDFPGEKHFHVARIAPITYLCAQPLHLFQ